MGEKSQPDLDTTLHFDFVGMLFALAIGQVAVEVGNLVTSQTANSKTLVEFLPAYGHLFLATIIIAASWVGWGSSGSSRSPINSIISWDFIELLIDVFLVVCYFVVVRSVESLEPCVNDRITPSAAAETLWTTVILVTYFFWDCLTKITKKHEEGFWQRGWASLACALLSIVAYFSLPTSSNNLVTVLVVDLSLLLLIILFRIMKLKDWSELSRCQHLWWTGLTVTFLGSMWLSNCIESCISP